MADKDWEESLEILRNTFNEWKPKRIVSIEKLKEIRYEIQQQKQIHRIGNISYSAVGIVGAGLGITGMILAPFTFGVSLGLTATGAAVTASVGGASSIHTAVKRNIVDSKVKEAQDVLNLDDLATEKLISNFQHLETVSQRILNTSESIGRKKIMENIIKNIESVSKVLNQSTALNHNEKGNNKNNDGQFIQSQNPVDSNTLKKVANLLNENEVKSLAQIMSAGMSAAEYLMDAIQVIWNNAVALAKNELCDEAKELNRSTKLMQQQLDEVEQLFQD